MPGYDYKNYDNLNLIVKKNKVEEIISNYKEFGWEVRESTDNSRYDDLVDISMIRPHNIDNKDERQLLQVYMEENLNSLGRLNKTKYSVTTIFALTMAIIMSLAIAVGVWLIIDKSFPFKIFGCSIVLLALIGIILGVVITLKLKGKDKKRYDYRKSLYELEIQNILDKVKSFSGDNNG